MMKVYGKYLDSAEARKVVEDLMNQGYTRGQVRVISNTNLDDDFTDYRDDEHKTLWEKIKDFFTFDEYSDEYWEEDLNDVDRGLLEEYRDDIHSGHTVILVKEDVDVNHPIDQDDFVKRDNFTDKTTAREEIDRDINYLENDKLDEDCIEDTDLDREAPCRDNTKKEKSRDLDLDKNPLDKPYPEKIHYERDLKESTLDKDKRDEMIEKDVDVIDDIDKVDEDIPL